MVWGIDEGILWRGCRSQSARKSVSNRDRSKKGSETQRVMPGMSRRDRQATKVKGLAASASIFHSTVKKKPKPQRKPRTVAQQFDMFAQSRARIRRISRASNISRNSMTGSLTSEVISVSSDRRSVTSLG